MSEINNNNTAEELNEVVEEVVDDATVMTVPIDDTLSISGEAADAKAVGDALANKIGRGEALTRVTVNGVQSDSNGSVNITGADIPMSSASGAATVGAAMDAMNQSLSEMEQEIEAAGAVQTVNGISPDANKNVSLGTLITAEEQELTAAEAKQARANIHADRVYALLATLGANFTDDSVIVTRWQNEDFDENLSFVSLYCDKPSAMLGDWTVELTDGEVKLNAQKLYGVVVNVRLIVADDV